MPNKTLHLTAIPMGSIVAGESIEQIISANPRLNKDAIHVALDFATKSIRADVIYPVSSAPR